MSSEISTYIETLLKKKDKDNSYKFWKLDDDQSKKAVTGICFIFGVLFIIGLFANLTSVYLIKLLNFPICRKSYIINLNTSSFFYNFFLFHSMPSIWTTCK